MTKVPLPMVFQFEPGPVRYSADQLKAYGDARVRAALEAAVELVEQMGSKPLSCADAIRRLMP